MKLRELAHSRAGDKGDISNISVIAYASADYAFLAEHVTAARVRIHLGAIAPGKVTRFELPHLAALNFVLEGALGGGVTRSTAHDQHGKSLSSSLLEFEILESGQEKPVGSTAPGTSSRDGSCNGMPHLFDIGD